MEYLVTLPNKSTFINSIIRNKNKILLLILILSFFLRFIGGFILLDETPKAFGWYKIASNVIDGKKTLLEYRFRVDNGLDTLTLQYYAVRPPLFLLFYVMIIKVFEESLFFFLFFQSLLSVLLVYVCYRTFTLIFSKTTGIVGAAIVGFYPHFVSRTWNSSEDNLYMLLIISSFYMLFKYFKKKDIKFILLTSFLLGLAFMTRSTILFFVMLLLPCLFLFVKKNKVFAFSGFAGVFMFTISPLLFYNYSIYGEILLSDHSGSRFWVANNKYISDLYPETSIDVIERYMFNDLGESDVEKMKYLDHLGVEKLLQDKACAFIKEKPALFLKGCFKKAVSALSIQYNPRNLTNSKETKYKNIIHQILFLPLFIAGIFGIVIYYKKAPKESLIFIVYYLSLILISMIFWAHTRHTIPYYITFIYGLMLIIENKIIGEEIDIRN